MPTVSKVSQHPGSSAEEIADEPEWTSKHSHRVGYRNEDERLPGLTHEGDSWEDDADDYEDEAIERYKELRERVRKGDLVNFQDVIKSQPDFHLHKLGAFPPGWRFMVDAEEDFIKWEQEWPANIKARKKKQEAEAKTQKKKKEEEEEEEDSDDEESWRRKEGEHSGKHNDAMPKRQQQEDLSEKQKSEYQKLREKYSPQEIALLRNLQQERDYIVQLEQNDGKRVSPVASASAETYMAIDQADQATPDNWIPRSQDLIRLTGRHPLNAEPKLNDLFDAGLVTPNALHYVRNHGAVPRLFWETHKIDIENGTLVLSMNELKSRFTAINIQVALACDGNRRGELNLIKKSKSFSYGPGAISCSYWQGAPLHEVLAAAGITTQGLAGKRMWVNFEGSDELSEGRYATCIPLEYAMDPTNDVLVAYEMNNTPLPPDHGYPCRIVIPGFVGGRSVKWLARIWTSDKENDSHYHIWDNRVLPHFITEKDGAFADTLFHHPSTACNEQNLNSVIVRPAEGETLTLDDADKNDTYRVEGFAYDGGGHEVQRVEITLDDGATWLSCIRQFPDAPLRHGNRFWTWVHWYADVDMAYLFRAESIAVRCFNVFKNTQPRHGTWNLMGMMNNGWYVVKPEFEDKSKLVWRHPFNPEGKGGWMKPSTENQLKAAKNESGLPDKQFTRKEVEKHSSQDDCWIVINNNVYDATSVLKWHPGGASAILAYAGRLTAETTSSYESIHDDYAHKKLKECVLGRLTDKAANFIQQNAKAAAEQAAKDQGAKDKVLRKNMWLPVTLKSRNKISEDTHTYKFELPEGRKQLGMATCQHIQFGFHMRDKMLVRPYTPTRPILESEEDGTFELTVKTYYPSDEQPGGAFSNFLLTIPIGETVEVKGPSGKIIYLGKGEFEIEGNKHTSSRISLILGGSGITPGYQLISRILNTEDDKTELRVIDANKGEGDILLRKELDELEKRSRGQLKVAHILSHPSESWLGLKGYVNEQIIKDNLFKPEDDSVVLLCGPPALIQKAALPALKDWGYEEEKNMWGF